VRVAARLDADAVTRLVGATGATPAERLELADLVAAGWEVEGPTMQADGGLEVVITQRYDDPAEAARLFADLGGPAGPFDGLRLTQERTFFTTKTVLAGAVDLERGLEAFTDPELRAALEATDGAPLGVSTEQLEQRFGAALDRLVGLQLAVALPGAIEANAPTEAGNGAVWPLPLGERTAIEATSERRNVRNLVALAVAATSAVALVGLVALRPRRRPPA
ncbi:MAG: hypothetical protein M3Q68_02665, partial [Actinomycetota bacterium]|nr:hypothetical protein [Actinomycetota bacterium]